MTATGEQLKTRRVITTRGLGRAIESKGNPCTSYVVLDKPSCHRLEHRMPRDEVCEFGTTALIRVLNITGAGLFSNMQFYSSADLARTVFSAPGPPDETRFWIDLETSHVARNRSWSSSLFDCVRFEPRIDGWTTERGGSLNFRNKALESFEDDLRFVYSRAGRISGSVLIDLEQMRLLGLGIIAGARLIYRWPEKR